MTKLELFNRIVDNHNRIANIEVHGESAILVADTLKDLRNLLQILQTESIQENNPTGNKGDD